MKKVYLLCGGEVCRFLSENPDHAVLAEMLVKIMAEESGSVVSIDYTGDIEEFSQKLISETLGWEDVYTISEELFNEISRIYEEI